MNCFEAFEKEKDTKEKIRTLYESGNSVRSIIETLNVSSRSVAYYIDILSIENKYRTRPNSRIVLTMACGFATKRDIAEALGITVKQLKYKLLKDDFSMRDFLLILFGLCSISNKDNERVIVENIKSIYKEAKEASRNHGDR